MVLNSASDEELLIRFRNTGDTEAFRLLVERTAPGVRRIGMAVGLKTGELDDLVQNTYLVVVTRVSRFDPKRPASAWIRGIARKHALRSRSTRRATPLMPDHLSTAEGPRELASRAEARAALFIVLPQLRPRYRRVIELYYLEHRSAEAIAELLGRRPSTVRTQLRRGVRELRRSLPTASALRC